MGRINFKPAPFKNPAAPEDVEVVERLKALLDEVAKELEAAWKMGIEIGYSGIPRDDRGKYKVVGFAANKRLYEPPT